MEVTTSNYIIGPPAIRLVTLWKKPMYVLLFVI